VDGTDVETWGALHGDVESIVLDGVAPEDDTGEPGTAPSPRKNRQRTRARVRGKGADGRNIYTADPDARAGYRSATSSRAAGPYNGYELHLGVQTRDLDWTDKVLSVKFGPEVPGIVNTMAVAPAGSHRADAVVPHLISAKNSGADLKEVLYDRGYSQLRPETHSHPLNRAGIEQTFQPKGHQRLPRPYTKDAIIIEGQLFSAHLPDDLRGPLSMPPQGASEETKEKFERDFNRRASYRYTRHAGPDADGTTRWKCPFHSGLLRSRSLPYTMRKSRKARLVDLPEGARCCGGILSVPAGDLPIWQRISPGTTAWRKSMGRRLVVETANGALKGGFVNIERKFLRVFGRTKTTVVLAFTIVGHNLDRIRSFIGRTAAKAAEVQAKKKRAKRRRRTWSDLIPVRAPMNQRSPP
jgi:hypothetical protein